MDARAYFATTPWEALEKINEALCHSAGYEPGPTPDGYEPARALWEKSRTQPLTFLQAADLCRECHRLAPFRFFNGNTFASCARVALAPVWEKLPTVKQAFTRAALGHYIAGAIDRDELIAIVPPVLGE
ncbi:MAG: hypothetical protein WDO13_04835 [Verrucomicrobiota bacterium]